MAAELAFVLIYGIKFSQFDKILIGLAAIVVLLVLQYIAGRFCKALEQLNRKTGGYCAGSTFLDSFAALFLVLALASLFAAAAAIVANPLSWLLYVLPGEED